MINPLKDFFLKSQNLPARFLSLKSSTITIFLFGLKLKLVFLAFIQLLREQVIQRNRPEKHGHLSEARETEQPSAVRLS